MFKKNLLTLIGNTPLVHIPFNYNTHIFAKLEYTNPGGSVKDRPALYMIEEAEKKGLLKPGDTIIDASSGNFGIAVAMIGKIKGYRVIITVSEKISREKLQTMQTYGTEVIVCPATQFIDDPKNYHAQARSLQASTPNSFMPDQYFNINNRQAYYHSLGPELWNQTNGNISHLFAGAGTGGTISGVGRYLKEKNSKIKIYAIDSTQSYRATKGNPKPYQLEGIGIDFESNVIDYDVIDDVLEISDDDGIKYTRELANQYGFLVGPTSGAVIAALHKKAHSFTKNDVVVAIFGDSGRAYLSKNYF